MRVTGGRLGGRKLISPPSRSRDVRPTSDRARETLFALLGDVSDLSVLDLFCGTGALALEAISRGADSAVLVDRATALAARNAEALGLANRCELVRSDAVRYLERSSERFGLVFCDPPYKLADRLEPELSRHLPPRLARFSRLVVESPARRPLAIDAPKLQAVDERRIGEALIRIYERR
jgi:16S rRNA (guanine(966)-N(2))-methyltransferase RsmD